jgi:lactate permease
MWPQPVDPLGHLGLSALAAALPIFFLFWALAVRKLAGHLAGMYTVAVAVGVAVIAYRMPPHLAAAATVQGALYGLFPIGWIVVAAVFLYRVTVESGQFDIIKRSIASLTDDRRLQALLIAFSFGAFLEGAAGFGTPVAISAAMLVGLGFQPLYAAGICLIANTAPVAFGAIGTPIVVAGQVTGIDDFLIAQMVGRQLPFLSVLVPCWLVVIMAGWKGFVEVWPAALVSGGSFAVAQWWTSNYIGPLLPDILSSLVSIACLVAFLRVWRPRRVFRFEGEREGAAGGPLARRDILRAWSPFIVLTVLVGSWGIKPVKALLDQLTVPLPFPLIHHAVLNAATGRPVPAVFTFNWLSATGTAILVAALVSVVIAGMRAGTAARLFGATFTSLRAPLVTVAAVLGFAYIGNASGMTTTMGMALAGTGRWFPFFSPVLGWLGVFMTGSDTSANAVFGRLQAVSAERIGMDPLLAVAANASGGVTGKMISPQSIAVACAATGLVGNESGLFRFTVRHSLLMVGLVGVMTWLQANVLRWMVPTVTSASTGAGVAAPPPAWYGWACLVAAAVLVTALAAAVRTRPVPPRA